MWYINGLVKFPARVNITLKINQKEFLDNRLNIIQRKLRKQASYGYIMKLLKFKCRRFDAKDYFKRYWNELHEGGNNPVNFPVKGEFPKKLSEVLLNLHRIICLWKKFDEKHCIISELLQFKISTKVARQKKSLF